MSNIEITCVPGKTDGTVLVSAESKDKWDQVKLGYLLERDYGVAEYTIPLAVKTTLSPEELHRELERRLPGLDDEEVRLAAHRSR